MYTLHATFDAQVDQEETLAAVLGVLPEGTRGTLEREPVLLDVDLLDDSHIGSSIRANIGTPDEFGGVLEKIYLGEKNGLLVIVNGAPHSLNWWDTVQIIPAIAAGEHTADEPEESEDEFNLVPDDYNAAIDLVVQVQEAVTPFAVPSAGWLTRPIVEEVVGRVITDHEFAVVSGSVALHLTRVVDSVAHVVIAQHWALYEGLEADNA